MPLVMRTDCHLELHHFSRLVRCSHGSGFEVSFIFKSYRVALSLHGVATEPMGAWSQAGRPHTPSPFLDIVRATSGSFQRKIGTSKHPKNLSSEDSKQCIP